MTDPEILDVPGFPRTLAPKQRCLVQIARVDGSVETVIDTDGVLLEAPNWTLDGTRLVLNGDGALWTYTLASRRLEPVSIEALPPINNDHVLDTDGEHIFLSAMDGHIYRAPIHGGRAERVTSDSRLLHFLHGISPDGVELAFIGIERPEGDSWGPGVVYLTGRDGSGIRPITDSRAHTDGSEYSPDGQWIYLNTELFDGHAQIGRVRRDGTALEQLTTDARVNWFPHLAPAGDHAVYIAFPEGTEGHPADLDVELRLVRDGDWAGAKTLVTLFGGQGTVNVNSWSPEGDRFAFVSYPIG
ncbi:TolB family protein [Agromyces albus]|uniref:Biopolymer transporter Tol n=1 Tax=Agromyces albus TaxID=205332 RepID=A0A4V1QY40_9MICO|nr:biopolymer transporter Tol [Agromyces albus]RXZ71826.1 biopolymer transporter Tol [Agromyces albus]